MSRTFSLCTIGCRLNQYELEAVSRKLESLGFRRVPFAEPADLTVINTCTVTARADRDGRNAVRRARRASPAGKLVVTGCYAQAQPEAVAALGAVDLVVDNLRKDRLAEVVVDAFGWAVPESVDWAALCSGTFAVRHFSGHTRAMVKIQDGCQEACAYCLIPRARGRERSRPPASVLAEAQAQAAGGYKEVVLTGVHVGKYRSEGQRLADLLRLILARTSLPQIRLTSLEPREFRPDLFRLLVSEPRLCPHLHVPLQSGHDEVLRAMRRGYDTSLVESLFARLVAARPELALGTDVITGFPGETTAHFEATVDFVRALPLAYLHVFSYSDRPGTAAAARPDKVGPEEIRRRTRVLRTVSRGLRARFLDRHIGRTVPVLIERRRERRSGLLVGMSGNYMRVLARGPDRWMNEIVPLRIVRREGEMARGEAA